MAKVTILFLARSLYGLGKVLAVGACFSSSGIAIGRRYLWFFLFSAAPPLLVWEVIVALRLKSVHRTLIVLVVFFT